MSSRTNKPMTSEGTVRHGRPNDDERPENILRCEHCPLCDCKYQTINACKRAMERNAKK